MTRELQSIFIKNDVLYLAERLDGKLVIRTEKYDNAISAAYNMPSSRDVVLPTDQVVLNQYGLTSYGGIYEFEYQHGEPNGYITYYHDADSKKDIFFCSGLIVHVQDYEVKSKEDEVIDSILSEMKYADYTPESFMEMANKKLGEAGIDIEKEVAGLVFEKPKE